MRSASRSSARSSRSAFRGGLGSNAPADLAAKLDQPAAVVAQLPADTKVSTYVRSDSSQSIGNAFDFVGQRRPGAAAARAAAAGGQPAAGADRGPEGAGDDRDQAFVSARSRRSSTRWASPRSVAALVAWIGAAHRVPLPAQAQPAAAATPAGAAARRPADATKPRRAAAAAAH